MGEIILDCLGEPSIITEVLISEKGRQESQIQRRDDKGIRVMQHESLLAKKTQKGAIDQGTQAASRSWKRPGK